MQRRELLQNIARMTQGTLKPISWDTCSRLCFQSMYGLPWELQLRAACFIMGHYLRIFETKWPEAAWARTLINNVPDWHEQHGREVPDSPGHLDLADAAYMFCFDAVLFAYHYRDDLAVLAAASCCAISHAIQARSLNIWVADDPKGTFLQSKYMDLDHTGEVYTPTGPLCAERRISLKHQPENNVAYVAVARREWSKMSAWLTAEAVGDHVDLGDPDVVARALKRWEEHEFLLMWPEDVDRANPSR